MRFNYLTSLLLIVLLSGCSSATFLAVEDGPKGFLPTQSIGLRAATDIGALAPTERYSFLEVCDRVETSTWIFFKTNNYHNCELLTKYMQVAARTTATGYVSGVIAPVVQTAMGSAATAYGMHQIGRGIGKSGSNISSTTNNSSQGGDASAEGGEASAEGGAGGDAYSQAQGGAGGVGQGGQGGVGQGGQGGQGGVGHGGNVGNVSNNSSATSNAGAMSASNSASNSSATNNNNGGGYTKPSSGGHHSPKPTPKPSAPVVKQNNYTKQNNTNVIKQNMNVGGTNY